MSHTHSNSNSAISLSSIDSLVQWLSARGIDLTRWGKGAAKTVSDLWQELQAEESILFDAPPRRAVNVVQVIIRRGDRVLMETAQELAGGRRRQRNLLPAEKMRGDEAYCAAAQRCLWEELGIPAAQVQFKPGSHRQESFAAEAYSYPGLPTHYTVHRIEAAVSGLPPTDFWRNNASFAAGDPVKRHHWSWRTPDDL